MFKIKDVPVLYISGQFSHDDILHGIEHNILTASRYALEAWRKGWAALTPHKNSKGFQHTDLPWDIWVNGDLAFIARLDPIRGDALFMLPDWEKSKGATLERQFAMDLGLTIYYAVDGIPEVKKRG